MAEYFVGKGGNDGNAGTSWALRKLTIQAAVSLPPSADDEIYVGAGTYRETVTFGVSGSSGNAISLIGDICGAKTDGVGGEVRITGSDNDQTATRANCIAFNAQSYWTVRGIRCDLSTAAAVTLSCGQNQIIEDCVIVNSESRGIYGYQHPLNAIIRRCIIAYNGSDNIRLETSASNQNILIENCLLVDPCGYRHNVSIAAVGGITVRDCTILGGYRGIHVSAALPGGQTTTVNNCLITGATYGLSGTAVTDITEDYNNLWQNNTERTNTNVGAHSTAYAPLLDMPKLLAGFILGDVTLGRLHHESALIRITGSAADDLYGITRPATASKLSRGAIQFTDVERSTDAHGGAAAPRLNDAGTVRAMRVLVSDVETTFSIYGKRGANYAGTNPQMIIRQPGQSDDVTTDTGAAGVYNLLSTTLTPAAAPGWVDVLIRSNNTASSGDYTLLFDTLEVQPAS